MNGNASDYIPMWVHTSQATAVHRFIGQLPATSDAGGPVADEAPSPSSSAPDDERLIRRAYDESRGTGMLSILDFLADHPEEPFTMVELAKGIGRDLRRCRAHSERSAVAGRTGTARATSGSSATGGATTTA